VCAVVPPGSVRPLEEEEAWEADVRVDGRTEVAVAGLVHVEPWRWPRGSVAGEGSRRYKGTLKEKDF
jgi:hypothetical protein